MSLSYRGFRDGERVAHRSHKDSKGRPIEGTVHVEGYDPLYRKVYVHWDGSPGTEDLYPHEVRKI